MSRADDIVDQLLSGLDNQNPLAILEAFMRMRHARRLGAAFPDYVVRLFDQSRMMPITEQDQFISVLHKHLPDAWSFRDDILILDEAASPSDASMFRNMAPPWLASLGQQHVVRFTGDRARLYRDIRSCTRLHVPASVCMIGPGHSPERVSRVIKQAIQDSATEGNTFAHFGSWWVRNGLTNLADARNKATVHALRDSGSGKPFVLIAPGPSLKHSIDSLKIIHDQKLAILCASSHALEYLTENEIVPDIVVTVDPSGLGYHFEKTDMRRIPAMVSGITCYPGIFKLPTRRHYVAGVNSVVDDWLFSLLGRAGGISSGGSVSTVMFELALLMSCPTIILVGLDLSFPDGQVYSGGADGSLRVSVDGGGLSTSGASRQAAAMAKPDGIKPVDGQRPVFLPDFYGDGQVFTSAAFAQYHGWFERRISSLPSKIRVFNTSVLGARIHGSEHVPLIQLIKSELVWRVNFVPPAGAKTKKSKLITGLRALDNELRAGKWPFALNLLAQKRLAEVYMMSSPSLGDLAGVRSDFEFWLQGLVSEQIDRLMTTPRKRKGSR